MDLVTLPIIIPLFTAVLALLAWRSTTLQCWIGVLGMAGLFVASCFLLYTVNVDGVQAVHFASWAAPFGIPFVADIYSAIMVACAAFVGLMVAIFSLGNIDKQRSKFGYYQFLHFMMMGVCGAFLTADIFNLFVWFEVMLISSFVLMALGNEKAQLEGALKYVILNLVSSMIFLAGIGILYGQMGTLNFADLAQKLGEVTLDPGQERLLTATSMLFLVAFGLKAGIFPLFFWLPASYHTPPVAVSAIFSGLLTKVGIYSLIRYFSMVQPIEGTPIQALLVIIAGLTMVTGVLGAVAQYDFRRLLSFHIISQIGYAVMGLAIFTPLALGAAVYFLVHNIFAKTNLFLVSGITERIQGTHYLKVMGTLYKRYPGLAICFIISAFSLAGMPPLAGFFAKLALIQAGFEAHHFVITGIALGVGLLTLFSMTKIFVEAFWKDVPEDEQTPVAEPEWTLLERWSLYFPVALMAAGAVILGLLAQPCLDLVIRGGEQLRDTADYIHAVMETRP